MFFTQHVLLLDFSFSIVCDSVFLEISEHIPASSGSTFYSNNRETCSSVVLLESHPRKSIV
uniref:Uncharacterized protein n=1 Tax=Arion vulgaris TaxID=1028688 RepID=A0A0B6ZA23_9EUPU